MLTVLAFLLKHLFTVSDMFDTGTQPVEVSAGRRGLRIASQSTFYLHDTPRVGHQLWPRYDTADVVLITHAANSSSGIDTHP